MHDFFSHPLFLSCRLQNNCKTIPHQTPIRIKTYKSLIVSRGWRDLLQSRRPERQLLISPWHLFMPQKIFGSIPCPYVCYQTVWLSVQSVVVHGMGETAKQTSLYGLYVRMRQFSNQALWFSPNREYRSPCRNHLLTECLLGYKCLLILHDIITCPCQLMGNRLYCYYFVRLCHFLLIILLYIGIAPNCNVRRLHICPG